MKKRNELTTSEIFAKNDQWLTKGTLAIYGTAILLAVTGIITGFALIRDFGFILYGTMVIIGTIWITITFVWICGLMVSHFVDVKFLRNKMYDLEELNKKEELNI